MQSESRGVNAETLKQLFQKSADVHFQEYTFDQQKVIFITCDAMVDEQLLNNVIIERVKLFFQSLEGKSFEEAIQGYLHIPALTQVKEESDMISAVYTGHVLLYFEEYDTVFSSNISKKPNRSPEETKTEVPIKGPRDNFIEDIATNIALVRKRLPTNSLCVEKFELGKRTKTTVALLYFDDVVDQNILQGIIDKLNNVDADIVYSGNILMEKIDKHSRLFPKHDYTGRPDFAVQFLARGRFVILIDGVAYGIIIPVNLALLFKTGEDSEYTIFFSSFERLIRASSILIGSLLPAFWLALTTFHQNQLPLLLLATVVQSRTGLPLPTAIEMILMIAVFELFREAGLRLPTAIGSTISVVGGLIIGDAAIRAGVTSPAMIVVIATSMIASVTLVNQSLVAAVGMLRIFFILLTSFFGLFGFFISLFFTILYLTNIRTFGIPYVNIAADISWSTIKKTIMRPPTKDYAERPSMLNPKDKTRMKNEKK